jgi:RNA polymerase sigma-70 factor (ECF subfamily)
MSTFQLCTDLELFEQFKTGDNFAFEEIYNRYWSSLIAEAFRLTGSKATAKDLVQDIFVAIYQKAARIEIKFSFRAYLFQTLRYKIINARRDYLIHDHCHQDIYYRSMSENVFSNPLETKELQQNLQSVVAELPQKCKQVFLLSREGEYSHKAISRQLNISTSTVEKHIVKALKILKVKLNYPQISNHC